VAEYAALVVDGVHVHYRRPADQPGREGVLLPVVGVRANGGFRVWDAEAARPRDVTLRLGGGIPGLGRSPRTEAVVARGQKRHSVQFAPCPHALIEPGHEGGISPMKATSRVQFERPRLERRQGDHRTPAAGRGHTRRRVAHTSRWSLSGCMRPPPPRLVGTPIPSLNPPHPTPVT
jgi:hypothetical protein